MATIELTERQVEILRMAADGVATGEMASRLYVETSTVRTHLRRLFNRLGARNRSHAVAIGFRLGMLS